MSKFSTITVCLMALALGVIRLFVPPTRGDWVDIYKDVAHVFVGMLIPGAWSGKEPLYRILFWLLCILEVAVAVISRQGI